jgi:hypothetical protein
MEIKDFKDALWWAWRERMKQMERSRSTILPLECQFGENWDWEDSLQCYELDSEFLDNEYFEDMDADDLIKMVRHMENFMMERGVNMYFFRNYAKADKAFEELDKRDANDNLPY